MLNLRLQTGAAPIQPPASGFRPLPFLIYTLKIRNRRNSHQISALHFSNLYKSRALSIMSCSSTPESRAGDSSFLIAKSKIRNSAKPCPFIALHFFNREKSPFHHLDPADRHLGFQVGDPSSLPCPRASLPRPSLASFRRLHRLEFTFSCTTTMSPGRPTP